VAKLAPSARKAMVPANWQNHLELISIVAAPTVFLSCSLELLGQ
jgi:hypothetical protein